MEETKKSKRGKGFVKFIVLIFIIIGITELVFNHWWGYLITFGITGLIILIVIKKRGYFLKDRLGNKLTFKEYMKRWKSGIEGITPLQQTITQIYGNWIIILGISLGIIVNLVIRFKHQWYWIEIILAGSMVLTIMQMISILQKYWRFKEIDKASKELQC